MNLCTTYIIYVKQIYNLIDMGFMDRFKESDEKKQERYDNVISTYNVFEGIKFKVIFPSKELKIVTHSGLTKGAATFVFGIVGLAATSSIKSEKDNKILNTVFQIADKGIVFKRATDEGKDLRIPFENIVDANDIQMDNGPINVINIILLENQKITILVSSSKLMPSEERILKNHIMNIIKERACGAQYEEAGWGLEHATAELQETKHESNSLMDELERLGNMYEKGLLTDEEFAAMKKKLIEGD